jgi:hypothetical protein
MNCAAIEALTKSLAMQMEESHSHVNCILLDEVAHDAHEASRDVEVLAQLLHFLLIPMTPSLNGSVFRLRHDRHPVATPPSMAVASSSSSAAVSISSERPPRTGAEFV